MTTQTSDPTDDSQGATQTDEPSDSAAFVRRIPRIGVLSWSFVGIVIAAIIVCTALGFVSEIVLPMTFAAVLAISFKPW